MKDDKYSQVVVVGVSESLAGLQALRYAVAEAHRRDVPLRAVRAWQVNVAWYGEDWHDSRVEAGALADATIRGCFNEAMGGLPRDLDFELIAVEGAVGPALVAQTSDDDDLLVLGAPARRWWNTAPFSVFRHCVRTAPCPVVVVPAPALLRKSSVKASARAIHRELQRYVEAGGQTS